MKYIFLSYSTKKSDMAYELKGFLENEGYIVWMAPLGIPVGKKYPEIIEQVIKGAEVFVLLASKHICTSNWIDKEVERAISHSRKLIVFRVDDCPYNDEFKFLFSCVQCSEIIHEISLNDIAFKRAYLDFKNLYLSRAPSKSIQFNTINDASSHESKLSKEEQIEEAHRIVEAFLNGPDSIAERLSSLHFKDINRYIFYECNNLSSDDLKIVKRNLIKAYDNAFLNPNICGRIEQAVKGQIIYYLTRLNTSDSDLINVLKKYYYEENNIWIRQSLAYGLSALNEPTIPFSFAKKIFYEEDEALVNRSWTLCFYQDISGVDAYSYLDDNLSDWANARNARLNRLQKNDLCLSAYLALDLAILYSFAFNRNYKFKPSEQEIIKKIKLNINVKKLLGREITKFVKHVRNRIIKMYCKP